MFQISYVDPRFIAIALYFLYFMISLSSMIALLLYLPEYLKEKNKKKNIKSVRQIDYLKDLTEKINMAKKSKYYRAMVAQLILKGFAFKSGYLSVTLSEIMDLVKEGKIEIPSEVKSFLTESLMFYSTFKSISDNESNFFNIIKKRFFNKEDPEKLLNKSIELLYEIYNE